MMPIYVINLDQHTERWQRITRQLDGYGLTYERIPGVLGTDLTDEQISLCLGGKKRQWHDPTPEEIGCYLSNRCAWENLWWLGEESGCIVLEDDADIVNDLAPVMRLWEKEPPAEPTIILLSYSGPLRGIVHKEPMPINRKLATPYIVPSGSFAYYLNRPAAKLLLQHRQHFRRPVDTDFRHRWETGVRCQIITPPIVGWQESDTEGSLITEGRQLRRTRLRSWRGMHRNAARLLSLAYMNHLYVMRLALGKE